MPPLRVLIADDNEDAARILAIFAKCSGHDVRVVHDGKAALALADDFEPNVFLLDVNMPIVNGPAAASRLRDDSRFKNATIIAITGYRDCYEQVRSGDSAFDAAYLKPVNLATIERIFDDAVQR